MGRNRVSRRAVLVGDVELGSGNTIEPGALIVGPTFIGDDNFIGPSAYIGAPPQHDLLSGDLLKSGLLAEGIGSTRIGSGNIFREFSSVNKGMFGPTIVGNSCYLMSYSHIGHDCTVGDGVKLTNSAQLAGFCWVGEGVYLGLSAAVHQFTVIGGFSLLGMGCVVPRRSLPPGSLVSGNPARVVQPNVMGLEKIGLSVEKWRELIASNYLSRQEFDSSDLPNHARAAFSDFLMAVESIAKRRNEVKDWTSSLMSPELAD